MKRFFIAIALFCGITAAIVVALHPLANAHLTAFSSGDMLGDDWKAQYIPVSLPQSSSGTDSWELLIRAQDAHGLHMLAAIATPFEVRIGGADGALLYRYDDGSLYARHHLISLTSAQDEQGDICLFFKTTPRSDVRLLLGSRQHIERGLTLTQSFYFLMYGVYTVIILVCLILLIGKPSERYLLPIILYSLISAAATYFTLNSASQTLTFREYAPYRAWLYFLPNALSVAVCLCIGPRRLLPRCFDKRQKRLLAAAGACAAALLILFHTEALLNKLSDNIYLLGVPVLALLFARREKCALPLLIGYALSHSLRVLWLPSDGPAPNHPVFVFIRLPLFDNIPFLFTCLLVVLMRFSLKFREAEQLSRDLAQMNQMLDARVARRTQALRLEQQRKQSLMINIFHDLRNPVFAIRGCLDMLQPTENAHNQRMLAIIGERIGLLQTLIEDLFLIEKLEEGKVEYLFEEQDIHRLCSEAAEAAYANALHRGIALHTSLHSGMTVRADAFRLKQALGNLLENAVHYTPEGGRIDLILARQDGKAVIDVRDNGKGISAEDLPNIFERYYHSKLIGRPKSTGLGLTIAKEIINAHQGSIEVSSEKGVGTTFRVTLDTLPSSDF